MVNHSLRISVEPKLDVMTSDGMSFYKLKNSYHISENTKKRKFQGAFYVSAYFEEGTGYFTVGFGLIDGVEPTLNGELISGIDEDGYPVPGGIPVLNGRSDGYVALKIVAKQSDNDAKAVLSDVTVVWVQEDELGANGLTYVSPLVKVTNKHCYQIAYFDYVYRCVKFRSYTKSNLAGEDSESSAWLHYLAPSMNPEILNNAYRVSAESALPSANYALRRWL